MKLLFLGHNFSFFRDATGQNLNSSSYDVKIILIEGYIEWYKPSGPLNEILCVTFDDSLTFESHFRVA